MQILTIRKVFEAFKPNSKHSTQIRSTRTIQKGFEAFSNANSKHSKEIRSIRIQIRTTSKGFKEFQCTFKPFEWDSKHSDANYNNSEGVRSIRIQIRTTWQGIQMQIRSLIKGFEAFECKL